MRTHQSVVMHVMTPLARVSLEQYQMSNDISRKTVTIASLCYYSYYMYIDISVVIVIIIDWLAGWLYNIYI